MPMLDIGVRAGYLYAFPGTIKLDISKGGYYMKLNVNFDASMIPIEGGFSFKLALPASPISLGAGVYAGYGLANSKLSMKIETNIPSAPNGSVEVPMQGGCLVVDILANAGMSIGPAMSLGLELGYRIANVSEMKSTQAVSNTDLGFEFAKDEVVKDENGDPVPFDFSGFVAGLKFTIGF